MSPHVGQQSEHEVAPRQITVEQLLVLGPSRDDQIVPAGKSVEIRFGRFQRLTNLGSHLRATRPGRSPFPVINGPACPFDCCACYCKNPAAFLFGSGPVQHPSHQDVALRDGADDARRCRRRVHSEPDRRGSARVLRGHKGSTDEHFDRRRPRVMPCRIVDGSAAEACLYYGTKSVDK